MPNHASSCTGQALTMEYSCGRLPIMRCRGFNRWVSTLATCSAAIHYQFAIQAPFSSSSAVAAKDRQLTLMHMHAECSQVWHQWIRCAPNINWYDWVVVDWLYTRSTCRVYRGSSRARLSGNTTSELGHCPWMNMVLSINCGGKDGERESVSITLWAKKFTCNWLLLENEILSHIRARSHNIIIIVAWRRLFPSESPRPLCAWASTSGCMQIAFVVSDISN